MKLVKMSLAAAVAVAGLSAASLSTSGYVQTRFDATDIDGAKTSQFKNETKVEITATSDDGKGKVVVRGSADQTGMESTASTADINSNWDKAYGEVKVMDMLTLRAGKFGIQGNFTDSRGDGVSVTANVGTAHTVTASYTQNGADLDGTSNLGALFANGNLGFASYKLDVVMGSKLETGYAVQVNVPLAMAVPGLSVDLGYGSGANKGDDPSTIMGGQVNYAMDMNSIKVSAGYTMSDEKKGGKVALLGGLLFGDNPNILGKVDVGRANDAQAFYVTAGASVAGVALGADYVMDLNSDNKNSSMGLTADYGLGGGASVRAGYAAEKVADVDQSRMRLQLKYSF